ARTTCSMNSPREPWPIQQEATIDDQADATDGRQPRPCIQRRDDSRSPARISLTVGSVHLYGGTGCGCYLGNCSAGIPVTVVGAGEILGYSILCGCDCHCVV